MAVVTTKSTAITNRDATPPVINDARIEKGTLRSSYGTILVGAADSITSYFPLVSVPSSAMIRAVYLTCVAGMTSTVASIGVFKTTKDSGGVALGTVANTSSDVLFAATQSLAAALARSDVTNVAGNYTTDEREMPLWQVIGLTADPQTYFDIAVKITTANTGAAGRIGLEVQYVDNGT